MRTFFLALALSACAFAQVGGGVPTMGSTWKGAAGGATAALVGTPSTASGGSGSSIAVTLNQPITAGDFLIILSDTTALSVTVTSISAGGSFVTCSASANTACNLNGQALNTQGGWVLSATGTAGPVTINYSGAITHANVVIFEYSCTGGAVSADTSGTVTSSTNTTPFAGVGLTLTGTNDVIAQLADGFGTDPTSISTYTNFGTTAGGPAFANLINTNSGTAPNWTAASNTGGDTGMAIAMKCQ